MVKGKNILIGVSSGIAIYKVLDLISKLKKEEGNVKVIMTENAQEFVSPLLFEIMSKSKVYTDQFESYEQAGVVHIELSKWADTFLLAPATANTLAKLSWGLGDNLLTSTALAYTKDLILAPAMNTHMLDNPNTQRNLETLKNQGHQIIEPGSGFLACNDVGKGRMAEPVDILDYLKSYFVKKDLRGKKIIVSAGPTIEAIDPVRYITNRSSGKMGYAISRAARDRGAEVILVAGPNDLDDIKAIETRHILSNEDLIENIDKNFDEADSLIMAAAPCDFAVEIKSQSKLKKEDLSSLSLKKNPDIIRYFADKKKDQILIGFAAETDNLLDNARQKLKDKGLDFIVANDVSSKETGFDSEENKGYIISEKEEIEIPKMDKYDMANIILDVLIHE